MKCVILADKRKRDDIYKTEEGLSIYIEHEGKKILLDCGMTDAFIYNSKLLEIDLDEIQKVVLSHGHYDHGDGLIYLKNKEIILHPACYTKRYSKRRNYAYAGINQTRSEIMRKHQVKETSESCEIYNKIYFLGEIERIYDVPLRNLPTVLMNDTKEIQTDFITDDSGLVIKTNDGIIVFGSCSHSGIDNIIETAKKVTHDDHILSVIGGFHLREIDPYTDKIIEYFKKNHIKSTYMGHCTKDEVIDYFKEQLKDFTDVQTFYVGDIIKI